MDDYDPMSEEAIQLRIDYLRRTPHITRDTFAAELKERGYTAFVYKDFGVDLWHVYHQHFDTTFTAQDIAKEGLTAIVERVIKEWNEPLPFQEGPDDMEYPSPE